MVIHMSNELTYDQELLASLLGCSIPEFNFMHDLIDDARFLGIDVLDLIGDFVFHNSKRPYGDDIGVETAKAINSEMAEIMMKKINNYCKYKDEKEECDALIAYINDMSNNFGVVEFYETGMYNNILDKYSVREILILTDEELAEAIRNYIANNNK